MTRHLLPITALLIGPDHRPGLHLPALLGLVGGQRADTRPLEVRALGCGHFEITNGRHRYADALIRGLPDIDCEVSGQAADRPEGSHPR